MGGLLRALERQRGIRRVPGPLDWYLTFNALDEAGWRDHSPSDLRQLFVKVGYRTDRTDIQATFIYANNSLTGNGLAPESLLAEDRRAVYTFPDQTRNLMYLGNVRGRRWLTDDLLLSGNVFYRYYRRTTGNGDVQLACVDDASGAVAFNPDGRVATPAECEGSAAGFVDQNGQPLSGSLEREAEGQARATKTATQDWGTTLQLTYRERSWAAATRSRSASPTTGTGRISRRTKPTRTSFPTATARTCSRAARSRQP